MGIELRLMESEFEFTDPANGPPRGDFWKPKAEGEFQPYVIYYAVSPSEFYVRA